MSRMPAWLKRYQTLPKEVYLLATGQMLINLIQSTYLLLLNLFLKQGGLDDPTIAALGSKRFIATFLLAIPGGLWLRGKPLRWPLFYASLLFPITALLGLEAARNGHLTAAGLAFVVMGAAGLVLGIASLPMMMRLAPEEQKSEALSLQFATWAAASICGGLLASGLQALGTVEVGSWKFTLDAHATLLLLTLAGFAAPLVFWRLKEPALPPPRQTHWLHVHREDFGILFRALVPSTCIAIGAGLSIQFMNLFFSHIFGISASAYSAYVTISNVLVLIASLILPEVRRRLGWRGAILGVQCTAVILLAAMGMTELVHSMAWAAPLAIVLFILRQPLMSMAGPAVNELTMLYVGTRNHELVSACNGAIWSGSWWVAAVIFQHLRAANVAYWQIFCATSILYFFGSFAYLGIIRATERKAHDTPVSSPEQKEFPA